MLNTLIGRDRDLSLPPITPPAIHLRRYAESSSTFCEQSLRLVCPKMAILRAKADEKSDSPEIAKVYRLFFLFVEPFSALVGAYYAYFQPQTYLDLTHEASSPKLGIPKSSQIVLAQLANLYLLFALNESLILRATSNIKIWRTVLLCLLIADVGHLFSVKSLGIEIYWDVMSWNAIDCGNVGFVYLGAMMRISFLAGFGVQDSSGSRANRRS